MRPTTRKGLDRLRAMAPRMREASAEMAIERGRFDAIREGGPTQVVTAENLFQTPRDVAADLAAYFAELTADMPQRRFCEPSAGLGRLYTAARHLSDDWTLVEIAPQCAEHLYQLGPRLIQDDFLTCDVDRLGGLFDGFLMNPPFRCGRDVKHIRHAYELLAPGGVIVGLCYDGARQNKILRPLVDSWDVLPADSFKGEGTRAGVARITWRKA